MRKNKGDDKQENEKPRKHKENTEIKKGMNK